MHLVRILSLSHQPRQPRDQPVPAAQIAHPKRRFKEQKRISRSNRQRGGLEVRIIKSRPRVGNGFRQFPVRSECGGRSQRRQPNSRFVIIQQRGHLVDRQLIFRITTLPNDP